VLRPPQRVELPSAEEELVTIVTRDNFTRAETDNYFASFAREGALGKVVHNRTLVDLDHQTVIRMNRDTLYSRGLFDLDAGPVTITLPDSAGRFMSVLAVDEDHYAIATFYDSVPHQFTREQVGTRYLALLIRTFVDPGAPSDLEKVHALQDAIHVKQASSGEFEIPAWDATSLAATRAAISTEHAKLDPSKAFGKRNEVEPLSHLIGTAMGWGGNPARDATYVACGPEHNDGTTAYRLTVKDVPVDGFWSVTVYNSQGYFERNARNAYSLNNLTAKPDADGSYTIQFGGCDDAVANCLPISPGWNYTVRLYRPRAAILDGTWKFPDAVPVG
jgi:hypothetical protein